MIKKSLVPLSTLLLIIAVTVVLFSYRDRLPEFENLGYLGAFLISLISNATIVLPMPGLLLIFALGAAFNPILVGLVSGAGGAIGEISGYMAGRSGHGIARNNKWFIRAERWMKKWGMLTIFAFSVLPVLPFDAAGVTAGILRYPIRKLLLACFIGKSILYTVMSLFGAWGWEAMLRFLD